MADYHVCPELFKSVIARRLYEAMKPGIEAARVLVPIRESSTTSSAEKTPVLPVIDVQGYVLLDSIAEPIPITEPKLEIKKPEEV